MKKRKPPKKKPGVPNGAVNRNPTHDGSRKTENGNGTPPDDYEYQDGDSPFRFHTGAQRAFLAAYIETGQVKPAIAAAGIGQHTHKGWLANYPGYKKSFHLAQQMAGALLESEAVRRAVDGVVRMKFHEGRPIMVPKLDGDGNAEVGEDGQPIMVPYVEHHYSDTLMVLLLKANHPKKYRERQDIKMDVSAKHRVAGVPPEKAREKIVQALNQLAVANGGKLPNGNGHG